MKKRFLLIFFSAGSVTLSHSTTYIVDNTAASASDSNSGALSSPLLTIGGGLKKASAGDTVLVQSGAYCETVVFSKSGTAQNPIVLKAEESKNVCIRGADVISNFKKCTPDMVRGNGNFSSIYWAELPNNKTWQKWDVSLLNIRVLQDNQPLKLARWPVSAWFPYGDHYTNSSVAEAGDSFSIIDNARLTFPKGALEGSIVTLIDISTGKSPCYRTITAFDSGSHRITVCRPFPDAVEPGKDLYYIENNVSFLKQPGEFVIDTFVDPDRLYLWPLDNKDPNTCAIMASKNANSHLITWAGNTGYIVIEGFYISDAGQQMGIGSQNPGHHIEIKNCILARASLFLVNQSFCAITHCVQTNSLDNGINISQSNDISLVENEICNNNTDGITVGHNSRNVNILRNYIHDLWSISHPDGIQLFRNVYNITIDSNLIYNCGQGIMTEEVDTGAIVNNMIIGTHGAGLILGYGNAMNVEVRDNTIFYTGYSPFSTDSPNNKLINNLIGLDYALARFGWKNATNFIEDYNLFFASSARVSGADTAGMGPHTGRSSNIIFKNGCAGRALMVGPANVAASSLSSLKFDDTQNDFNPGDFIEINFDNVIRKVIASSATSVSFEPPLDAVHPDGWDLAVNWKSISSPAIDLRLTENSDGFNSGVNGTTIGSSIDIQAYRHCDFNGDGKRDIPLLPDSLYKAPFHVKASVRNGRGGVTATERIAFHKNRIVIALPNGKADFSFAFYQLNGRKVLLPHPIRTDRNQAVIDLRSLAKGAYIWRMKYKGKENCGKALLH
jgi:hypothetical protein